MDDQKKRFPQASGDGVMMAHTENINPKYAARLAVDYACPTCGEDHDALEGGYVPCVGNTPPRVIGEVFCSLECFYKKHPKPESK